MVFAEPFDHFEALEDVDDVIHPSPFDSEPGSDLLEEEGSPICFFKAFNESLAEVLQTFFFPVVAEDLVLQNLLLVVAFGRRRVWAYHFEYWNLLGEQQVQEAFLRVLGVQGEVLGAGEGGAFLKGAD